MLQRKGINASRSEDMGSGFCCGEQAGESLVADIEAARIGTEGGQNGAAPVAQETASAQEAATASHFGDRMQMAGEFAGPFGEGTADMPQADSAERKIIQKLTSYAVRSLAVVITRNPDPVASLLQGGEQCAFLRAEPFTGPRIVKGIAKGDHETWPVKPDQLRERREDLACIIGWKENTARGIGRTLFQMQIGDDQGTVLFQKQGSRRIGEKIPAGDG